MPSHEPSSALWSGAPSRAPVVAKNRWPKRPPLHRYARESGVVGPVERGPLPGPGCREESVAEAATAPQARARVRRRGPCGAGPAPGPRLSRRIGGRSGHRSTNTRAIQRRPSGAGPAPGPRLSRRIGGRSGHRSTGTRESQRRPCGAGPAPGPRLSRKAVAEAATAPQARARVRCRGPCGAGPPPGPRLSRKSVAEAATAPQARARVRRRGWSGARSRAPKRSGENSAPRSACACSNGCAGGGKPATEGGWWKTREAPAEPSGNAIALFAATAARQEFTNLQPSSL
jgi:hypothetical protein